MKLLPSEQTAVQLKALRQFLDNGAITLCEPCGCGDQVRHNNGGNYHAIYSFKADGGKWFARYGSTSDYDDAEWEEVAFARVLDDIQKYAARGYYFT